MYSLKLNTFDGRKLNVSVWDEVENKRGAVYISHGMAEHSERYNDFACFLNSNGFIVLADDHRGHKYNSLGAKGKVKGDSFFQTVEDGKMIVDYIKDTYNLDVVILGHSYGSFLSQRFIELYSGKIKGAILSGTAYMKVPLVMAGKAIANLQAAILGGDKTGNLINKLSFGEYNKPFISQGQNFAWLSRDRAQVAKYENDEYCGYPMSIGFYKSFFNGVTSLYGKDSFNIRKDLPILIAVGSDDPVSERSKLANRLYEFYLSKGLNNVKYVVYDGARHEILNEINNQEVYQEFLNFIIQHIG